MRWPWQGHARTSSCPQPRLLPSATIGICFEAFFTITWRPKRRPGLNAEERVRSDIHATARRTAANLEAADLKAAQDTINAALSCASSADAYRLLAARVSLRLSPEAQECIAQQQADDRRIQRLQFLKTHLYDHPELVVLDRLEHHSPGALSDDHVGELQRLSRLIRSCDRWWTPLLHQWEGLGKGFGDMEKQQRAMLALLNSLKALDASVQPDLPDLPQPPPAPRPDHP